MKHGLLFSYINNYNSPIPKQEAMDRVQKAFTDDRAMRISPIRATEDELAFETKPDYYLEKNAFLPEVAVRFEDADTGTTVQTRCQVKRIIRIFTLCYSALLAVIELLLLTMQLRGTLDNPLLLLLPVIMFGFMCTMTFFGLRLSSRDVLFVIRTALQQEEFHS